MEYLLKELTRVHRIYEGMTARKQNITALYYKGRIDAIRSIINELNRRK